MSAQAELPPAPPFVTVGDRAWPAHPGSPAAKLMDSVARLVRICTLVYGDA